eukprot:5426578-Amphidinium_carterae.1
MHANNWNRSKRQLDSRPRHRRNQAEVRVCMANLAWAHVPGTNFALIAVVPYPHDGSAVSVSQWPFHHLLALAQLRLLDRTL